MPRQVIQDSVDISVEATSELTTQIDDLNVSDGTRVWNRAPGLQHGLWCLDQLSVLPLGPGVVATGSGTGRWIYFGASGGGGGGGVPPGNPNSIAYYDPAGVTITTDAALVAAPLDAFGRPQIWDYRNLGPGLGTIWRQGAWQIAGDAVSVKASGFVSYGSNALDAGPSATDGGEFLATPHSFGQYQVVNGVNGNNPFPVCAWEDASADAPGIGPANTFCLFDDTNVRRFSVDRPTGNTFIAPNGFLFMGNNGVLHGSSARIQLSTTIANAAQFRGYQYGVNAASAGITTFKSRAAAIGGLGAVLPGDLLGRWTAIGVGSDGASIQLAATLSLQVPTNFVSAAQSWVPTEFEVALVALTGPANSRRPVFKVSSEGEAQSFFSPTTTSAGYATYNAVGDIFPTIKATSDAIGGLVQMGSGAAAPDTRIRRIVKSLDAIPVSQIVLDDNASGAVNVLPATDGISKLGTRDAGSGGTDATTVRWAEINTVLINTGDLNLIDKEKDAHWTIVEERDRILVLNRKTGKRYAMALTPLEEE